MFGPIGSIPSGGFIPVRPGVVLVKRGGSLCRTALAAQGYPVAPAAAVLPAEFRMKPRSVETGVLPAGLSRALGKLRYHSKRKHGRVKRVLGSLYFSFPDDKMYVKRGCGETDMSLHCNMPVSTTYSTLMQNMWFYTVKIATGPPVCKWLPSSPNIRRSKRYASSKN